MKTSIICISIFLITIYSKVYSQVEQFDQVIIGNKSTMPSWASMWIEGNNNPQILLNQRSQPSNKKLWLVSVINDEFRIMTETDNFSAIKSAFIIKRGSGINVNYVSFPEGSVGIGTTNMGPHKLAVEGSIGSREVKVQANGWSDFVFEDDYPLRKLEEVENYIRQNKHLPEIPSESEVMNNGINLGEMNAKLLQKIEELTLYIIEQNKQISKAQQSISELRKEVDTLKK